MQLMLISLLGFIIGLILCFCLVPLARRIGFRMNIVDLPNYRKIHTDPTPCSGGLAIYFAFFLSLGIMYLFFLPKDIFRLKDIMGIFVGSTLLLGLGIYDDTRQLRARVKFIWQVAIAIIVISLGLKINTLFSLPLGWLAIPISLFWFIGFINTINLIDGLDGLASGIVFIISLTLLGFALFFNDAPLSILTGCLCGTTLIFLYFNFRKEKIFLGDNGSMLLGFLIAGIPILSVNTLKGAIFDIYAITFLCAGVPILDVVLAIIRRVKNKVPIFKADQGHIHHRLLDKGIDHRQVVVILYAITLILGGLAVGIVWMQGKFSY
ncbi:undecaprenyl/decaprenyl-phosphate alpha-N-acetylglucosaminyl 1-phosphate transferase [Candidatus Desantisbacteria bacterium]|nr:undecaprenyl/decaprenyl-phosphate alpha-N-acetylglucosaminyl 1-phosphate transferase [Candidatus Desantisbacteria bacterium]